MQNGTERQSRAHETLRRALVALAMARHAAPVSKDRGDRGETPMAKKNVDAVLIEQINWVLPAQDNLVAFEAIANDTPQVFALDGAQAIKLAEGLMAHLPPEPGEPLQIHTTVGPGEHGVTDMSVDLPQNPSEPGGSETYQLRIQIGDQAVVLSMRHQELVRWVLRMQRDIQEHRRRHAN